jgi:hypothetical protein
VGAAALDAALLPADDGGDGAIRVGPAHLHAALRELRAGGDLTRTLLGAQPR